MQEHSFHLHNNHNLLVTIEERVSASLGRRWQVATITDKVDEASHPAALLSDGVDTVFVKINQGALAWDQLQTEVAGLHLLSAQAGVLTPQVIATLPIDNGALVIMESVAAEPWHPAGWRACGRALAQIHSVKEEHFGLATHGYWGSLYQDNRPLNSWPEFFWGRRVEPRLRAASDSGNLPSQYVTAIERFAPRLADLCGPPVQPSLLHGDAHQNNIINTAAGPVFIDPAVYYGHPEMDLAFVDFFAPVGAELYEGYAELSPLDPGFEQRRGLWLLPAWLAMVQLDGPQHVDALAGALALAGGQ
ncbi:MAG: fructosamine kinase family protein [Caldilineaceae bacterium]|nr:fructosamine kinase family protein [Caldilineaceae bacterium]